MTDEEKQKFTLIFGYGLIPDLAAIDMEDHQELGQLVTFIIVRRSDSETVYVPLDNHPATVYRKAFSQSLLPETVEVWLDEHVLTRKATPEEVLAVREMAKAAEESGRALGQPIGSSAQTQH